MAQTKKKLTVKEIKALEPKSDVYELNSYCKYLIMVKKSSIDINQNYYLMARAREVMKIMAAYHLPCAVLIGADDDIKIMELIGEKE